LSKGFNIQEFSVGDTPVGDGLTLHPLFFYIIGCRVDVSPTDVSPTENSWMLRPLNKASLGHCVPDRCVPTLDRVKHAITLHQNSSVGRYRGLGRPPAPKGSVGRLAGFAYAPDQVYWIGAPPSDARSAHTLNQSEGMVRSGAK
jgi:hypothetical protein